MVNSVSGVITILTMILSCVKMVISINIKAIQKSLNKITTVQKTHKLWGRCPRPLDSPTSLSESEREAERTFSRFAPIYIFVELL